MQAGVCFYRELTWQQIVTLPIAAKRQDASINSKGGSESNCLFAPTYRAIFDATLFLQTLNFPLQALGSGAEDGFNDQDLVL